MEISNSFIANPTVGRTPPPNEAAQRPEPAPATLLDASSHTPSPELVQIMNKLRETPEIRKDVLEKVAQRLSGGEYVSTEAAEGTAEAMLKALE